MRALARWVGSHVGGRPAQPGVVRAPDGVEDTGIWGVGGPAMREPGSTGILRSLKAPGEDSGD
ncbi:MAG: hypothetical protein U1F06_09535 [Steroidobacteraceae bacterium]